MPNVETTRRALIKAAAQRSKAEQERRAALDHLNGLVVAALNAGMGPSEVARLAGVSRQHVHNLTR